MWDRCHRVVNDWCEGLGAAGLTATRLEWCCVLAMRSGPWAKAAHHRVLLGAAAEFFERCDSQNPVHALLYPDICADLQKQHDTNMGTIEHIEEVFVLLRGKFQQPLGEVVKTSRWWSWENKARNFIADGPGVHATLMLLVYIGWKRRWWRSFEESPLGARPGVPRRTTKAMAWRSRAPLWTAMRARVAHMMKAARQLGSSATPMVRQQRIGKACRLPGSMCKPLGVGVRPPFASPP